MAKETTAILKRIEADPTEPAHYIQLSAVYRKNNQFDRARASLQQALYTRLKPAGDVKKFIDYALSPAGQAMTTQVGYFPLN